MRRTALFSEDKKYRFHLGRYWDDSLPLLGFLLTNPSKAGTDGEDNTSTRAIERAKRLGYGGTEIVNAFAYIDTQPTGLLTAFNPVGPGNDRHILTTIARCKTMIVGWGECGKLFRREQKIYALLDNSGYTLHCLGLNKDRSPKHPLYLSYDIQPQVYRSFPCSPSISSPHTAMPKAASISS